MIDDEVKMFGAPSRWRTFRPNGGVVDERYAKIVVTDDRGHFLIPDLPRDATYTVWSRGYGLVDGPRLHAAPGETIRVGATIAPDETAAAQFYPAGFWSAMVAIPTL